MRISPAGAEAVTALVWTFGACALIGYFGVPLQTSDFPEHIQFLRNAIAGKETLSYPLFHAALYAISFAVTDMTQSGRLAAAFFCGLCGPALLWYARWAVPGLMNGFKGRLAVYLIVPLITLFGAASIFTYPRLYIGYISPNTYHNPTVLACKPFAAALFLLTWRLLDLQLRPPSAWLTAAAAALCILAKPSFVLALLPAAGVFLILSGNPIQLLQKRGIRALLTLILPALTILIAQYLVLYEPKTAPSGIVFDPMKTIRLYTRTPARDVLLSYLFPLTYLVLNARRFLDRADLKLALFCAAFGASEFLLLAETGARASHGNFGWSAQLGAFVLFAAAALHLAETASTLRRHQRLAVIGHVVCYAVLLVHLASGAAFWWQARTTVSGPYH